MLLKIFGKNRQAIGYLHQNMIVNLELNKLQGVVLGSCVYNINAQIVARVLKSNLCNENGYIVATLDHQQAPTRLQKDLHTKFTNDAWQLLSSIKDHSCCWTNEKQEWAAQSLTFAAHLQ